MAVITKPSTKHKKRIWSGLQARMTLSYIGVSVGTVLLLELLLGLVFLIILTAFPLIDNTILSAAKQTAQTYALEAAIQASGPALNPRSTFQPGQPTSLTLPGQDSSSQVPYIDPHTTPSKPVQFALLIAPNGQVIASSYPAHYPPATPATRELPARQMPLILNALAGSTGTLSEATPQGIVIYVAQPIWDQAKQPIGAIYVQTQPVAVGANFFSFARGWLSTAAFWAILLAPVGAVFGILTTRGLVRRLHRLVRATAQFAHGDYTQRVPATSDDEVGQLESQFNQMAEQLVASIAQQKVLIEQHARLEERARIEQEMRTAQYIQRTLLPKEVPTLPGWQLAPFYQPAREVGGDFYDFLLLDAGRLGLVIGDVAGKGVPAALVMATTCTMLRAAAQSSSSPGEVLARVNDLLAAHMPSGMFVTCFYAILDPASGHLRFANAGHDWPYRRCNGGVSELRATGMPLGMLPGLCYEENETTLAPGESLLFYSDGLVEAHNRQRDMFGLPHLKELVEAHPGDQELITTLLGELAHFTGEGWEQEDDVTMVAVHRTPGEDPRQNQSQEWHLLSQWTIPSAPGNERQVMEQVAAVVQPFHLSSSRLDNLKTAVAEATMNAMEHGNHYQPDKLVTIQVLDSQNNLAVRIHDEGGDHPISEKTAPDLDAKLAGLQGPRGWGLFLIKNLVDDLLVTSDEHSHTVELIMHREAASTSNQDT